MALPNRVGNPLDATRRIDHLVARNCIAVGRMLPMCPLVDFVGPGLDRFCPFAAGLDVGYSQRSQHAHDFVHRNTIGPIHNHKAGQVVGIRKVRAIPRLNRYRSVKAEISNITAGGLNILSVGIQAVDEIPVVASQSGRKPAVAAIDVDNQSTLDAGLFQNFAGGLAPGLEG